MPLVLNWLFRLLPTNPVVLRIIASGSRRWRHLMIRGGYLAVMIAVMLFVLLASLGGSSMSMRGLAAASASIFQLTAYIQILLICLLTPVFMAGAIVHESSPKTWDILLTTPLNSMQIVLGNLGGRYFFVLALLMSSLPLFALLQLFGGVPGSTILASYAIAAASALVVAAVAVTLSVTRTGGRRAVFVFYVMVVVYLAGTGLADTSLGSMVRTATGVPAVSTTWLTAINPFLAIDALLSPNTYITPETWGQSWWIRQWMGAPVSTFNWLCVISSTLLVIYSTIRVRWLATQAGTATRLQRLFRVSAASATTRPPRLVGHNPIAWREAHLRRTLSSILTRWGFLVLGLVAMLALLGIHMVSGPGWSSNETRSILVTLVMVESLIVMLTAINLSATAVSREREDGSLDLILTTPIQPGPYLKGKLLGLIHYLAPMIALPVITMVLAAIFVWMGGFGSEVSSTVRSTSGGTIMIPLVPPSAAVAFAIVYLPFIAFCVMVGLHWSIRSKGTIGAIVAAVVILLMVVGLLGVCGLAASSQIPVIGPALACLSPGNILMLMLSPTGLSGSSKMYDMGSTFDVPLILGGLVAASAYVAICWGMHRTLTRTFMMTVRRLSGTN